MMKGRKRVFPKRGDVWLVNFDPTIGSEIRKTRPVVVLQNDVANQFSPVTIVAAITSRIGTKAYPTEILIKSPEGGLTEPSFVLLNQIRTADRARLLRKLGVLKPETLQAVDRALEISLGLVEL